MLCPKSVVEPTGKEPQRSTLLQQAIKGLQLLTPELLPCRSSSSDQNRIHRDALIFHLASSPSSIPR